MRDTIYRSYEFDHGRYFGDDFSKTIRRYFKKIEINKPDFILTTVTSSQFFTNYVAKNKYILITKYLSSELIPACDTYIYLWERQSH